MTFGTILAKLDKSDGHQNNEVPLHFIKEVVADSFHIDLIILEGRGRDEVTALARQTAMYLIRLLTSSSLARTGQELGGRSPATVSWGFQRIASGINSCPSLNRKIENIKETLQEKLTSATEIKDGEKERE